MPLNDTYQNLKNDKSLTNKTDLILVKTAGHIYGHISVLLKTDQGNFFFAGDVVYHQTHLFEHKYCATTVDYKKAKCMYSNI